jgi:hypothetical protein
MNRILIILSFLILSCFVWESIDAFQKIRVLKEVNLAIKDKIQFYENNLKSLEGMFDDPIDSIAENYTALNDQLSRFSQSNSLNVLLNIKQSSKEGLLSESVNETSWPGIKSILVTMDFYKIKGLDQFLAIYKFLELIENANPLTILVIKQKNEFLDVEIQLFGRRL